MKPITYFTIALCMCLFSCQKENISVEKSATNPASFQNQSPTVGQASTTHAGSASARTGACTFINSWKASSGYTPASNSLLGAVWVEWKLDPCTSPSGRGINITLTLTKSATGTVLYTIPGMYAQQRIDFDNLQVGTAYHVNYEITDYGTGALLESRSADLMTPSHNAL